MPQSPETQSFDESSEGVPQEEETRSEAEASIPAEVLAVMDELEGKQNQEDSPEKIKDPTLLRFPKLQKDLEKAYKEGKKKIGYESGKIVEYNFLDGKKGKVMLLAGQINIPKKDKMYVEYGVDKEKKPIKNEFMFSAVLNGNAALDFQEGDPVLIDGFRITKEKGREALIVVYGEKGGSKRATLASIKLGRNGVASANVTEHIVNPGDIKYDGATRITRMKWGYTDGNDGTLKISQLRVKKPEK